MHFEICNHNVVNGAVTSCDKDLFQLDYSVAEHSLTSILGAVDIGTLQDTLLFVYYQENLKLRISSFSKVTDG